MATELHGYAKGRIRDHIAVQTVGAITPGAPALNSVRSTEIETSQFEQSSIKELQLEKAERAFVIFEKSSSPNSTLSRARHSPNIMPMEGGMLYENAGLLVAKSSCSRGRDYRRAWSRSSFVV